MHSSTSSFKRPTANANKLKVVRNGVKNRCCAVQFSVSHSNFVKSTQLLAARFTVTIVRDQETSATILCSPCVRHVQRLSILRSLDCWKVTNEACARQKHRKSWLMTAFNLPSTLSCAVYSHAKEDQQKLLTSAWVVLRVLTNGATDNSI